MPINEDYIEQMAIWDESMLIEVRSLQRDIDSTVLNCNDLYLQVDLMRMQLAVKKRILEKGRAELEQHKKENGQ